MSLLDRIFEEPELRAFPPVLVDVGAAGGVYSAWRRIARHSIGVGFEPDAREGAPLDAARRIFSKWIFCPALAVPAPTPDGKAGIFLTRSPQCSSTLRPNPVGLRPWAFADRFDVVETKRCAAMTLEAALRAQGLERVDWLKCDTQGTDLRLFQSLPSAWRARLLAVEFEPGLIDAYEGEDRATDVMSAMAVEPFWLAEMDVGRTPRAAAQTRSPWFRRLAPRAPAWVNLRYLRHADLTLDRRGRLLSWAFATITGQHAQALALTAEGDGEIFSAMAAESRAALRWSMWRGAPGWAWRRLTRGG